MRQVDLRSLDLNLLVILRALLAAQHVSRAAEQLGMSQPAVSRSLKRLREVFDDPLLVRGPDGLSLTDRAMHLQEPLDRVLGEIHQLVSATSFDPARASGSIRLGCLDLEASIYLGDMVSVVRRDAPGMDLEIYSHPGDFFTRLARGQLHLAISGLEPRRNADQFHRRVIDRTWSECLMSAKHPLASGEMTLSRFLDANHGIVSITGEGPALMDDQLRRLGRSRRVMVRLSSFFNVPDACLDSDVIFSLPHRMARRLSQHGGIVRRPLPDELRAGGFPMYLYWHARHHADAMHRWLRQTVVSELLGDLED